MRLEGKTAFISGAARGLGAEMARLLHSHGANVMVTDILEEEGEKLVSAHDNMRFMRHDVLDEAQWAAAMQATQEAFGGLDILVNNAGITQPLKIMEIRHENYDAVLDVNLLGTLNMSQAVIPHMRERQSGKLVNMSSVSAQRGGGIFGGPHYSAAKAGVLGLTKAMARELAPDGIRANAICPGFIATDITAGKLTPEMKVQILAGIPMGRAGEASDVAGCALFLASDLSAYVTGSEVDVNGGSLIH